VIVPLTPTVPPPRRYREYVAVDEVLMFVDPNEYTEGVDWASNVTSVAVNESTVVPPLFTSLKSAVRVPLVFIVRVPVLGIGVPQPMQLEPLRVTSTGVSGVYVAEVPVPVALSRIVVITPDVAPFFSFEENVTLMVTDTGYASRGDPAARARKMRTVTGNIRRSKSKGIGVPPNATARQNVLNRTDPNTVLSSRMIHSSI
jgi:hypothetical protein